MLFKILTWKIKKCFDAEVTVFGLILIGVVGVIIIMILNALVNGGFLA
jgi:hypothetical protein